MSKYSKLWEYIKHNGNDIIILSFENISNILGFEIDHSFLKYKIELIEYGYEVFKISLKNKEVNFSKINKEDTI